MQKLIEFSLRNRLFVIGGILTIMWIGLFALMRVPFDAFPDLSGSRVEVITVGPVTQGDADAVLEVCRARGLVDAGLYRSEWRDA